MKKFLALAAVAVAFTGSAFAQESPMTTTPITVSGRVVVPITCTVDDASLDFPTDMARGQNYSIDAQADGAKIAKVDFAGDEGDAVKVELSSLTLSTTAVGGGPATLPVTFNVATNTSDDQSSAADYTPGSSTNFGTVVGGGTGSLYVYIGGSVSIAPTQQRGAYSGSFTATATYMN